jgi:hypothetical protein
MTVGVRPRSSPETGVEIDWVLERWWVGPGYTYGNADKVEHDVKRPKQESSREIATGGPPASEPQGPLGPGRFLAESYSARSRVWGFRISFHLGSFMVWRLPMLSSNFSSCSVPGCNYFAYQATSLSC